MSQTQHGPDHAVNDSVTPYRTVTIPPRGNLKNYLRAIAILAAVSALPLTVSCGSDEASETMRPSDWESTIQVTPTVAPELVHLPAVVDPLEREVMRSYLTESEYMITGSLKAYMTRQMSTNGVPVGLPAPEGWAYGVIGLEPESKGLVFENRKCAGSIGSCNVTGSVEIYTLEYYANDYTLTGSRSVKPLPELSGIKLSPSTELVFLIPEDPHATNFRVSLRPSKRPDKEHEVGWIDIPVSFHS